MFKVLASFSLLFTIAQATEAIIGDEPQSCKKELRHLCGHCGTSEEWINSKLFTSCKLFINECAKKNEGQLIQAGCKKTSVETKKEKKLLEYQLTWTRHHPSVGAFPKGVNESYGFPDGVGALIVEGPFQYKNGPPIWSEKTPWGAYGLMSIPGATKHANTSECTPIPSDSPFFGSKDVHPVALTNGENTMCMLGCDLNVIMSGGIDPCHIASVHGGPTNSIHSCFDVGKGFAGGSGVCGYNCSAFESKRVDGKIQTCTATDMKDGNCEIFCNSQGFPQ